MGLSLWRPHFVVVPEYLKYGLGIILFFVGLRLLLAMNEYINSSGALVGLALECFIAGLILMITIIVKPSERFTSGWQSWPSHLLGKNQAKSKKAIKIS